MIFIKINSRCIINIFINKYIYLNSINIKINKDMVCNIFKMRLFIKNNYIRKEFNM